MSTLKMFKQKPAAPQSFRLPPPARRSPYWSPWSSPSPGASFWWIYDRNMSVSTKNHQVSLPHMHSYDYCFTPCFSPFLTTTGQNGPKLSGKEIEVDLDQGQVVQDGGRIRGRQLRQQLVFQAREHHLGHGKSWQLVRELMERKGTET